MTAASRRSATTRLEELFSGGRTLFLVSHSEANLQRFCTRGSSSQKGRLILDAAIHEALEAYAESIGETVGTSPTRPRRRAV